MVDKGKCKKIPLEMSYSHNKHLKYVAVAGNETVIDIHIGQLEKCQEKNQPDRGVRKLRTHGTYW